MYKRNNEQKKETNKWIKINCFPTLTNYLGIKINKIQLMLENNQHSLQPFNLIFEKMVIFYLSEVVIVNSKSQHFHRAYGFHWLFASMRNQIILYVTINFHGTLNPLCYSFLFFLAIITILPSECQSLCVGPIYVKQKNDY